MKSAFVVLVATISLFASWGSGTSAGSLTGDVWTPGRDNNGAVNLISWNLVPENKWIEIAQTRLDALDSVVKRLQPNWRDRGNEGWNAVTDDWNGMAWDNRVGYERGWLAVAGGHDGGSNDGIYEFNLGKMGWKIQRLPQDNSWWPASYNASYTNFTPSSAYYVNHPDNPEGVYNDEFVDTNNIAGSLRTPTARHTYGSQVFVPTLGDSGKILMGCRRYWEYDFATNKWSLPKFPFGNQVGYSGEKGYTGENMQGWWNATEGRYYVCATQNYAGSQTWSVVAGGTGWRWEGGYPVGGYQVFYTAQEQIGNTLYTLAYDDYPANLHGRPASMVVTNLTTKVKTSHAIKYGSTLSTVTFTGNWWDGQGMTFVSSKGKWLCNVNTTVGMKWAWIDTATWTLDTAVLNGSWPVSVCTNLENKVKYFPELNALIWVNRANDNIRVVKFSGTGGTELEKIKTEVAFLNLFNSPEPFNPKTTISYQLPVNAEVLLTIYNAAGRKVSLLESGKKMAGVYSVVWNATNLNSGTYLCKLDVKRDNGKSASITRRMVLIK
ncbi:MAG: hypothetical protein JNL74_16120 [Fibrobacteres bacterium]|nr:hypothetical protein [Fibrobacterota bacterium]